MALTKYLLLLPLTYNDKTRVPKVVLDGILEQLFDFAGGYTVAGAAKGAYRMKSGQKQIDSSVQVWIVIEQTDAPQLRNLVADICRRLNQEVMYLERAGGDVEFIPPLDPVGGDDT
jgi:hypothetical protein